MVDTITGTEPPAIPDHEREDAIVAWGQCGGPRALLLRARSKFDPFQFSPEKFAARIKEIFGAVSTPRITDLSAFQRAAGKLILKGNGADYQRSRTAGIDYYQIRHCQMGQDRVDQFIASM